VRVDERQKVDLADFVHALDLPKLEPEELHERAVLPVAELVAIADRRLRHAEALGDVRLRDGARDPVGIGVTAQRDEHLLAARCAERFGEARARELDCRLVGHCQDAGPVRSSWANCGHVCPARNPGVPGRGVAEQAPPRDPIGRCQRVGDTCVRNVSGRKMVAPCSERWPSKAAGVCARSDSTRAPRAHARRAAHARAAAPLLGRRGHAARGARRPSGRDQGIFQYIAWASRQGDPSTTATCATSTARSRTSCTSRFSRSGAPTSTASASSISRDGHRRSRSSARACRGSRDARGRRRSARARRVGVRGVGRPQRAVPALHLLGSRAARELLRLVHAPSVALQLVAQAPWGRDSAREGGTLGSSRSSGALSAIPWFGKPTYALFTLAQLARARADRPECRSAGYGRCARSRRGCDRVVRSASSIAYLASTATRRRTRASSPSTSPRCTASSGRARPPTSLVAPWQRRRPSSRIVGAVVLIGLIVVGEMPRRALAVALVPVARSSASSRRPRAFPYHFHPVTAGVHLQWLVVRRVAHRAHARRRRGRLMALVRLVPFAVGVLALSVATAMQDSPHIRAVWILWGANTAERPQTREYSRALPDEPTSSRGRCARPRVPARAHEAPDDRVQTYGMDPYVLFLAERLSATPYIYAYDLNVDAALGGGHRGRARRRAAGAHPAIRDAHEADLVARLDAARRPRSSSSTKRRRSSPEPTPGTTSRPTARRPPSLGRRALPQTAALRPRSRVVTQRSGTRRARQTSRPATADPTE
jgi:hypothetical protein